jgi:hypothetical protein
VNNAVGAGTPTGSVDLYEDGVKVANATLDGAGHVSFSTAGLRLGAHGFYVIYNGDGNFNLHQSTTVNGRIAPGPAPLP